MSSRTVAVVLKAQVDDYTRQMRLAQQHTTDVEKAARSATQQFQAHNEALTAVGVGMAAVGAAAAVGLAVAVKAATEYGGKMAQLQSLSHATVADMQRLSDAAMKQGQAFGYSATQVADAEIELTKAGRNAAQILGGDLKGSLALAAAGQMDVAKATQIAVSAVTQFGSSGATIPQVADALAAGADKALGSVDDLGQGLAQGGLVASQMGLTLNDTVGTLSLFAQNALMGSDAGTSLKNMFLVLQSPTQQAQKYLDEYNITAYDTEGHFVGIAKLAEELKVAFKDKSDAERDAALSTIFGSDAIRSANILYKEGGKGVQTWIDAVNDTGFASAQAAGKLNSLEGDVKKLSAAFQTDLIKAGSSGNGIFRGAVQEVTGLVEAIGNVPEPVMGAVVAGTALVAVVGLVGGAALIAVPKVAAMKVALTELGISGKSAAVGLGKGAGLALALTSVASGLAATAQQGTASAQQIALAGESATKGWKGLSDLFKGDGGFQMGAGFLTAFKQEQFQAPAAKILDGITFGITHFSDVYKTNEGAFDSLGQQLAGLAQQDYGKASQSFSDLVGKYKLGADDTKRLLDYMPAYRDELVKQAEAAHVSASDHNLLLIAQGKGAVSAKVLASAQAAAAKSAADQQAGIDSLAGTATDAAYDVKALSDAIAGFGSTTLDARAAQRDFRKAVEDAKAAVADSSKSDDDKQAALDGIARAGIASAAALSKMPDGAVKARDAMKDARKSFIDVAASMLGSRTKARELADQLGLIPANVPVAVTLSGVDEAKRKATELVNGLPRFFYLEPKIRDGSSTPAPSGPLASGYVKQAAGGPISGPGQKGVDSVYAILAPGEHVLTAGEVDRMGGQGAVSAFRADLMAFAKGGPVNAIDKQTALEQRAMDQEAAYQQQVIAQKKKADDAAKTADRAQKKYEDIDGSKKNAAAKKAAKAEADRAQKDADAESKKVDDLRDKRDKAKDAAAAARDSRAQLRNDSEDFGSAELRGGQDPLGYVDQLRQMSRDGNYSKADRANFDQQANAAEKTITSQMAAQADYTKQIEAGTKALDASNDTLAKNKQTLDDATSSLESLKSTASQLASGISSAISGQYQASSALTAGATDPSSWIERDGIRFQTSTTGGTTADSLQSYYAKSAGDTSAFAGQLQRLASKGINQSLLAEIAGYGPQKGGEIADALLAASDSQFQAINTGYAATRSNSDQAGNLVSDYTYGSQISAAQGVVSAASVAYAVQQGVVDAQTAQIAAQQAAADQITAALTGQGDSLRNVIGKAFGLKGYAIGTQSATAGVHWVGEHGPELVGFGGGERVLTAEQSRRWVRGGGMAASAPQPITVQASPVTFPDTITVQDLSGFKVMARVVAREEIHNDAAQDAVLMIGGAA